MSRAGVVVAAVVVVVVGSGLATWLKYDEWFVMPKARQLLAGHLLDPGSAQFRNDRLIDFNWHCGEVNARNAAGGYGGFKRFISGRQSKIIYLEGAGMLGEQSNEEWIAILDREIAFNEQWAKSREKYAELGLRFPSESERREKAKSEVFDDHWKALCEPPAV